MPRQLLTLFAVLTLILGSFSARAADSLLDGIPESAAFLVRLKAPEATVKRLSDFAGSIKPEYAQTVSGAAGALGMVISNPAQTGVDLKNDWWLIGFGESGAAPAIAYAIPATDAEAMKRAVGERFKFASYEKWVIYSDNENAISQFADRKSGKLKAISAVLDGRSRKLFDRTDLGAYVNVRELRKTYHNQIAQAKEQVHGAIDQIGKTLAAGPNQGFNVNSILKVYGEMADGAFQLAEDTDGFAAGIAINPKGVDIEGLLVVSSESPTDKFLKRNPPSEMKMLGRFPADKVAYFGVVGDLGKLVRWGTQLGLSGFEGNESVKKDAAEALKDLESLKIAGMYGTMSVGNPNEGVLLVSTASEVDAPEKFVAATARLAESMKEIKIGPITQTVMVKRDAEKIGGHSVTLTSIKQEVDSAQDPSGMLSTIYKTMYGPNGIVTRITPIPGAVLASLGGGTRQFEELLKSFESGPGAAGQSAWSAARAQLPARANLVGLADVPRIATEALRVMADMKLSFLTVDDAAVAQLQQEITPSYLAASVTTESQAASFKLNVPLEQAKGIARVVEYAVTKLFKGGAP